MVAASTHPLHNATEVQKHIYPVEHLSQDSVKLTPARVVCGVRRCCQISYTVVISMLLVQMSFQ